MECFNYYWTQSYSQSLQCDEDKPCVNFCCAKNFIMRDHVCKKANETEDWHNINKNYDN